MEKLKNSFKEVVTAIIPMTVVITILGIVFGIFNPELSAAFAAGTVFTVGGMTLFMFGADISMMEVGRKAGAYLLSKGKLLLIVAFTFAISFAVTIAEPDVQVLAEQVEIVSGSAISKLLLMAVVGVGVGLLIVIAVMRIIFQKSLVLFLAVGYIVAFLVAALFTRPDFMPVAFDSGGVTTGPMTVPFILAFSAGITSMIQSKKSGDDSFGMVGLASLGPIISVLILGALF